MPFLHVLRGSLLRGSTIPRYYLLPLTTLYEIAPITPPMMGATQNNHTCDKAAVSANNATPNERAGLTEVLVTGIETK